VDGEWVDAGGRFESTVDNKEWRVDVDTTVVDEVGGIKASFVMKRRAPGHYPCNESLATGEPWRLFRISVGRMRCLILKRKGS
jgi:hypothetical protein